MTKQDKITPVYLRSADHSWIPALQVHSANGKATVAVRRKIKSEQELMGAAKTIKETTHEQKVVDLSSYPNGVLPMQNVNMNGHIEDYKDMVELPFMHEVRVTTVFGLGNESKPSRWQAAILYNLKNRHINEKPYTRTGDILIAVNPYQWYDDLYTEEKRAYYSNRLVWDSSEEDPRAVMEPHVYEVSSLSYKGLIDCERDQSILVSGESGAGKTETVKICLNHIASVQRGEMHIDDGSMDPTVLRVVQSNPLLEAFGNAKTRRNDNSSRFGKYLQLQFEKKDKQFDTMARTALVGSKCDVYLLEKNRVVSHDSEERTFHIFYQLLAQSDATKGKFWSGLQGKTADSFSFVGYSTTDSIEGMSDADRFRETCEALALVGVEGDKLTALMRAICVVMQLGNIGFSSLNGDSDKSAISTAAELSTLASLMGIGESDLTAAFTERTFTTANESHKVPLHEAAAKDACKALAKEIYQKIFLWVTATINGATADTSQADHRTIGLLDIFGFETFDVNRFEQLCINYANEKLQQKFTEDIFKSVQAEYEAEGIALDDIYYDDNTDVLDLIEAPTGLLALLNEECVRPKGNDFEYCQKLLQVNKSSPCLIVHRTDRMSFGIQHYAGKVMYDAEFFVQSNIDTLPTDLQECAEKCDNFIISTARAEPSTTKSGRRKQSNIVAPTVWTKYKGQLSTLMTNLRKTDSRYIRCIKPNDKKKPIIMQHNAVVEQLRCAGVVAGITITRSVFPNRLPNSLVLTRFSQMGDSKLSPSAKKAGMTIEQKRAEDCKALLNWALKDKETQDDKGRPIKAFVVGKTKTYFRAGALEWLEAHRVRGLDSQAVVLQKYARGWLVRNAGKSMKKERRAAELEAERRRQEEAARRERLRREALERKAARAAELKQYQDELAQIEKMAAAKDVAHVDNMRVVAERMERARNEVESLKSNLAEKEQGLIVDQLAMKTRQETKISEARKLIELLKKENKRLRKEHLKIGGKLEDLTENSEKLGDSFGNLNSSLSSLSDEHMRVGVKNDSLGKGFKDAQSINADLRAKVDKAQDRYMTQAQTRLEYQKSLARILTFVQERCRNASLVEDVVVTALSAETETKSIMAALDVETSDPNLILTSDSESESAY